MSDLIASNQNLPESTYDQERGARERHSKPDVGGAAVSPRDADHDTVRATPEGPSDRPGTEAEDVTRPRE
jgi:hypothetical protein